MPYLKFATRRDELEARKSVDDLVKLYSQKVPGIISRMNDPKYGLVFFYSSKPYLASFNDLKKLNFEIIPKEKITTPYAKRLRELHPKYDKEL